MDPRAREVPAWRRRAMFRGNTDSSPHFYATPGMPLTPRELEILRAAARWYPKPAARRLHIAYPTLKNHLASIRIKLGARTMTEAVLTAIGRGDLSTEDVLG